MCGPRGAGSIVRKTQFYIYITKTTCVNLCASLLFFFFNNLVSAGSIAERAAALRGFVESLGVPAVNMVAHSMGGLDARYLISKLGSSMNTRIATLTTVSTPHRGSPFMDWCRDSFGLGKITENLSHIGINLNENNNYNTKDNNSMLDRIAQIFDMPAYANLTTDYCTEVFNPHVVNVSSTEYFSYGGSVQMPRFSPLRIPHEIVSAKEGENDGIVSVMSARWGNYIETLDADHWALCNRWISKGNSKFDASSFYLRIMSDLSNKGF
jgi:triacylglycerol esterase/lipase EstA (alpha/beta hydrolase family)